MKLTLAKIKSLFAKRNFKWTRKRERMIDSAGAWHKSTATFAERLYQDARDSSMGEAIYAAATGIYHKTGSHAKIRAVMQTARQYAGFEDKTQKDMNAICDECLTHWKWAMEDMKKEGIEVTREDIGSPTTHTRVRTLDFKLDAKNKGNRNGNGNGNSVASDLDALIAKHGITKVKKAFPYAIERADKKG